MVTVVKQVFLTIFYKVKSEEDKMETLSAQIKTLYEDALYFHYLGEGYPERKARIMARKVLISLTNN